MYTRSGCHLCDIARDDLESIRQQYPHELLEIDIDSREDLETAYGFDIPVVEVGPYKLKAPFDIQELKITLGAAIDRQRHINEINKADVRPVKWTSADEVTYWFSRHYLALFNLFVIIYVGLPFLAPVMMKLGAETPARLIYRGYSFVCHQLSYRSIFILGEQAFYPREAAGIYGLLTYNEATGLSEAHEAEALFQARNFFGNDNIGFKVALCQRDIAIYGGILIFGLLYAATGRKLPPLPWYLWVVIGLVPIGFDGVSQLISQPPFNFFPFRESTPLLRILTGFLFGFSTAWFGYPLVEETMVDTRQVLAAKRLRSQENSINEI
jgi:uncharacterized membrane protein